MKKIKYIILAIVVSSSFAFAKPNANIDSLVMKALYYAQQNPKEAAKVWKELFKLTNNEKYLVEYFYASLEYKDIKEVIKELKGVLSTKKNKELYELLGGLYSKEGDTDGVIEVISNISDGNVESMYELGYLYSLKGNNKKALDIYKKLYKKEHSWQSLKGMLSILVREKKYNEAENILWKAVQKDKLPKEAYMAYAGLIDLKKDADKAVFVFKKLYEITKEPKYIKQLISLYLYKKDYDSLLDILQKTHYDDKLLYELYTTNGEIVKAYKVLYNLYNTSKNPKWLAERAILTYEIADRLKAVDDRVLNRMSQLFEKAFALGVRDAMYFNYYGYTLIDHDKDIKKGLEYVKKAIAIKPNNSYYLDSLAWGYYKLGRCQEAKKVAKKIKELGSVKEKEILIHLEKIDKCKEK